MGSSPTGSSRKQNDNKIIKKNKNKQIQELERVCNNQREFESYLVKDNDELRKRIENRDKRIKYLESKLLESKKIVNDFKELSFIERIFYFKKSIQLILDTLHPTYKLHVLKDTFNKENYTKLVERYKDDEKVDKIEPDSEEDKYVKKRNMLIEKYHKCDI